MPIPPLKLDSDIDTLGISFGFSANLAAISVINLNVPSLGNFDAIEIDATIAYGSRDEVAVELSGTESVLTIVFSFFSCNNSDKKKLSA